MNTHSAPSNQLDQKEGATEMCGTFLPSARPRFKVTVPALGGSFQPAGLNQKEGATEMALEAYSSCPKNTTRVFPNFTNPPRNVPELAEH